MKQIGPSHLSVRLLGSVVILAALLLTTAADWPTFLHDNQRTGTNPDETTLAPGNVVQLTKQWSYTTGAPIAASPTIVDGTVYVGSWDGYEYALDETTGSMKWKVFLGQTTGPDCDPSLNGVTSAATVQNGVVYVGGGDSYWYALDSASGSVLWKVFTGDNSPTSGHYNWSSPLIYNGYAYIGVASNCDAPLVQGQLLKVDLSTHQVVGTYNAVPDGQIGGGIWTSPSIDVSTNTIFVSTGTKAQAGQTQSQAIVALEATTLQVKSYWQLPDNEAVGDSDWGTTPILFTDQSGDQLVAATNKNGILYVFNRSDLAAGPIWRFQIAIGGECPTCGQGTVSSLAFMDGVLYAASGNTTINGIGYEGAVRALDPGTGKARWEHGSPGAVIPALAAANGFLADGAGNSLEVLDAATGIRLFSYATSAPIYAAPSIVDGRIFVAGTDGTLYALGLPAGPPSTPTPDPNCPNGWTCQDIGGVTPAGSDTVAQGVWNVTAGGHGVSGTSDQFRFLDQRITGDTQISTEVTAFQSLGGAEQAGLMVRQSSDPTAPYYAVFLNGNGRLTVQYRLTAGSSTITASQSPTALPLYLRIQRTADQFLAGTSVDGTNYALVPGSTVTVLMPNAVLVGPTVGSGQAGTAATARFSQVAVGVPAVPPASPTPVTACPNGWICGDIGNPILVGDQALNGNTWTVKGAGGDIWAYSDQFHYVWQSLTGDGSISAHVTTQTNTDPWAKAGVMLRQSTTVGAAYYAVFVTPGNGIAVQARQGDGYNTSSTAIPGTVPAYLQVTRVGTIFSAYTSSDGTNWTIVPESSTTLDVGPDMLAGLAVTAHNSGVVSAITFDSVTVSQTGQPAPTGTPTASGVSCPSGWSCGDVGAPALSGNQTLNGNAWSVQGAGYDIWNADDQFHYVWQSLPGDGSISAHITAQTNTDSWAKAGVMLRGSTDPAAPFYALFVTPGNGIVVDYRSTQGSNAVQAATLPAGDVPIYLRVTRTGTTISAYASMDGTNWTLVPGSTITVSPAGSMLAGPAVTAHNSGALSTATFDSVNLSLTSQPTATPTATTPPSTSTNTLTPVVGSACPSGWTCNDVGAPTVAGGQALNGSTWTVRGSGYDIWYAGDQFHYVQQSLAEDGSISAHVITQSNSDPWAKAGVMLRGSTDPGAPFYALFVTPSNGIVVDYRGAQGAAIQVAPTLAGSVPTYLRVARTGSAVRAYTSNDGVNWTLVPGSGAALNVSGSLLAGLAVTSHDRTTASIVTFDSVAITAAAQPTATPTATALTGSCPNGWSCGDVGAPAVAGGQSLNGNTWTIQGSGYDIWYADDQFRYVQQSLAGDGSISAHVTSQTNSDPWAKAGVMLRGSTDPSAPFYALFVTLSNGIVVDYRGDQGVSAVQVAPTLAGSVPTYLRINRIGSAVSAFTSSDGINWSLVPGSAATLNVSGSLLAGLAVTSHVGTAASIVTFDSVGITAAPPPSATSTTTSPPATATVTRTATAPAFTPTPTATPTMPIIAPTSTPSVGSGSCPSGWSCADVGAPNLAGGQSLTGSIWTVQGSGYDIWNADDQFHYVWQPLPGDGGISAHITRQTNSDPWAKAGLMLRGSVDPGAPFYAVFVTPSNGIVVDYRAGQGSAAIQNAQVLSGAVPAYLRVARTGTTFDAYTSTDGSTWTFLPGSAGTLSGISDLMAGLVVTSHNNGAMSAADFDSVRVAQ